MSQLPVTDPRQGAQRGEDMPVPALSKVLPGASPLFQLSWLREVFRYRNQEYGAYYLRQQYHRNMMWGGLLAIGLMALLYGGTLLAKALKDQMDEWREITLHPPTLPPPAPEVAPPSPPPVAPPPPPARPSITFVIPKVEEDDKVPEEYEPPTQEDMKDKNPGTVTTEGDPNGIDYVPDTPIEIDNPPPVIIEEEPKAKENKPFVFVEQMPAFRGNLSQFLAQELRYPEIAKENGVKGTVVIQFVINEKGEITNPFVLKDIGAGCGEEALRVVRAMPKWLPGAQRGVPVKVQMNLPIRFVLE